MNFALGKMVWETIEQYHAMRRAESEAADRRAKVDTAVNNMLESQRDAFAALKLLIDGKDEKPEG